MVPSTTDVLSQLKSLSGSRRAEWDAQVSRGPRVSIFHINSLSNVTTELTSNKLTLVAQLPNLYFEVKFNEMILYTL